MPILKETYSNLVKEFSDSGTTLVAVSKTKPVEDILELYNSGHRDFGENYVQELVSKAGQLPKNIRWHYIGHLQSNKVKYIAPFIHLIHGVDSFKLLKEINKQAIKNNRVMDCLLQVHIAQEETKFGFDESELENLLEELEKNPMEKIRVCGLMGMASFSTDMDLVRKEFRLLKSVYDKFSALSITNFQMTTLSMGMSSDYSIAIEEGSNMVRIGSLIFGERD